MDRHRPEQTLPQRTVTVVNFDRLWKEDEANFHENLNKAHFPLYKAPIYRFTRFGRCIRRFGTWIPRFGPWVPVFGHLGLGLPPYSSIT